MQAYAYIGIAGIGCQLALHGYIFSEASDIANEVDVAQTTDFFGQLFAVIQYFLLHETDGLRTDVEVVYATEPTVVVRNTAAGFQ